MTWWSSEALGGPDASPTDWRWDDLPTAAGNGRAPAAPSREDDGAAADEAVARAWAEGHEAGRREAAGALEDAAQAAARAAAALRDAREGLVSELRDDMVLVALAAARHIVGRELQGDADTLAELVREALDEFLPDQAVRIRVHPEDLSVLSSTAAAGGDVIPIAGGREVQWIADPEVVPGGCVLEGPDRVLDGRVDQTLERMYWRLKDA